MQARIVTARFPSSSMAPLIVLAGKEYGTGSSRDWAAKGTMLLGVKAVIAASYEREKDYETFGQWVRRAQPSRSLLRSTVWWCVWASVLSRSKA